MRRSSARLAPGGRHRGPATAQQPRIDPYEQLGERVASVLRAADQEAERSGAEAIGDAERIIAEARADADRIRTDAQARPRHARARARRGVPQGTRGGRSHDRRPGDAAATRSSSSSRRCRSARRRRPRSRGHDGRRSAPDIADQERRRASERNSRRWVLPAETDGDRRRSARSRGPSRGAGRSCCGRTRPPTARAAGSRWSSGEAEDDPPTMDRAPRSGVRGAVGRDRTP